MEEMLDTLRDECCVPYLDDVLCYAKSFDEHMEGVRKVLRALQVHGVKLRPEKCDLFRQEVRYVGRLVSVRPKGFGCRAVPKGQNTTDCCRGQETLGVPKLLPILYTGLLTDSQTTLPAASGEERSMTNPADHAENQGRSKSETIQWCALALGNYSCSQLCFSDFRSCCTDKPHCFVSHLFHPVYRTGFSLKHPGVPSLYDLLICGRN
ncbi:hypothetical protein SRHO_G00004480 [Serrasalmus rhombeus]